MKLVIVESPAKAKTINKYLGKDYQVLASFGHIRDLPSKDGSVLPDEDFAMTWELSPGGKKRLQDIVKAVKEADTIVLASDPDREGEAIAWHILEELKAKKLLKDKKIERVVFHEITKSAVTEAIKNPRQIDDNLVSAYMARRALDYLVGFTLSPVLWRKLPGSKSAGRVQSVALRLVCERENEIERFKAEEYWTIDAELFTQTKALIKSHLIQLEKTVKFDYLAVGAQHNFGIGGNRVDDYFVQNRRVHLAGNGTFPYKLIQLISVSVEFCFHFLRRIHNVRGTDGLVRFLSVFRLGFIFFCRFGQVSFAKIFQNCISAGADGFLRQVDGIGTHISDITVFIKFLCHLHGLLCRKAKFTGGFLLQSGGGKRRRRIAVGLFTLDIGDTKVLRLNFCFGF